MSTKSVFKTAGWLDLAAGPQDVTVSFKTGVGEHRITGLGTASAHGHWTGQAPQYFSLADGETLSVDGEGLLVVTAETFTAAFDALDPAS